MNAEGKELACYLKNYDSNEGWSYMPYVNLYDDPTYSFVEALDPEEGDGDYYAKMTLYCEYVYSNMDTDTFEYKDCKEGAWIYLHMWFNEPSDEDNTGNSVEATFTVKTQVYDETEEEYVWQATGESFTTTITANEDQSLTIGDFFRSESPVTINYETPKSFQPAIISFPNSTSSQGYENTPFLLNADGDYLTCWNIPAGTEEKVGIYDTYVDITIDSKGAPKSYLYDKDDNDYFLCLYVSGYNSEADDAEDADVYRLESDFNLPLTVNNESAVAVVETEEDAPVIYYNLNGQRVQNPSNGVFIRKQGSKTSKIIVR